MTKECEAALLSAISQGLPLKHAAQLAGISYDTLNRWKKRGEVESAPEEFRQFCKALERAEAEAIQFHLGNISVAGTRDWRASAWILERRHPNDFGREDEKRKRDQVPDKAPEIEPQVLTRMRKQAEAASTLAEIASALQRRKQEREEREMEEQVKKTAKVNLRE